MSLPENGSEGLDGDGAGGGAGGDAQVDPPQDGGGDGPINGAADLLNRPKERASGASSAAGSRDLDAGSVSSTSSFEGTDLSRVRASLGDVGPGLKNLDGRQHCSPMWFAMLEKGIKDKRITEDDAVAANAIIGFTRKVLDLQEDLRKYYDPEDIYDFFADELETACRFIAWVQFRSELPLEAAKTAYATVVAKRDRRTYKATKSGVVFVFDEQAKVYESYYKAQLKNGNTKSSKPSDDEECALEGKTSVAAATKALARPRHRALAQVHPQRAEPQRLLQPLDRQGRLDAAAALAAAPTRPRRTGAADAGDPGRVRVSPKRPCAKVRFPPARAARACIRRPCPGLGSRGGSCVDLPSVRPFASRARKAGARAAGCGLDRAALANSSMVAEAGAAGRHSARNSTPEARRAEFARPEGGTLSQSRNGAHRDAAAQAELKRAALGSTQGFLADHAAYLMLHGRRQRTRSSYCRKWQRFVSFCTHTLPNAYSMRARRYLPASERTVLLYLSYLNDEGRVHEGSLNPYLAAINQKHEDYGLPKPAASHFTKLTRKGCAAVEANAGYRATSRVPVPAPVMLDILRLGLRTEDLGVLRMCACVVMGFAWFNRADTGVQLQRADISIDSRGISIDARSKTVAPNVACTMTRLRDARYDPDSMVEQLLQKWYDRSGEFQKGQSQFWSLPTDPGTLEPPVITKWLTRCCELVNCSPPKGQVWTGHSLRSGGASACQAIDVPLFYIMHFGLWKSMEAVQRYLSALVTASDAAYLFFGWLRPKPYEPVRLREEQ